MKEALSSKNRYQYLYLHCALYFTKILFKETLKLKKKSWHKCQHKGCKNTKHYKTSTKHHKQKGKSIFYPVVIDGSLMRLQLRTTAFLFQLVMKDFIEPHNMLRSSVSNRKRWWSWKPLKLNCLFLRPFSHFTILCSYI